jgi:hypothetical protein
MNHNSSLSAKLKAAKARKRRKQRAKLKRWAGGVLPSRRSDEGLSGPPPDFLGIGAQKAGTTWLYQMLRMHPDVGFPLKGAHGGKEVHFWSVKRRLGLQWYRSIFGEQRVRGEISPEYATIEPGRIAEIQRYNPAMRLIYLLRNPIERAWSSENMRVRLRSAKLARRRKAQPPEAALDDEYFKEQASRPRALRHGDYATNVRNWRSVFPKESVLVVRYEDVLENPGKVLAACARHIGIDPAFFGTLAEDTVRERQGAQNPRAGRLSRELYDYLAGLHRDHVLDLERELGWDLSAWRVSYDEWRARRRPGPAESR